MRIEDYLKSRPYPGRILVGGTLENGRPFALYLISARSEKSKNRVIAKEDGVVKTKLYKEGEEDNLIIYQVAKENSKIRVFSNGIQTEGIFNKLDSGSTLLEALDEFSYEPDSLSTPRIALLENLEDGEYELGIVKKGEDGSAKRITWHYTSTPGYGHIISTYNGDDDCPEAFDEEPEAISLLPSASAFIDAINSAIKEEYRVALYALYDGAERIINAKVH